MTERDRPAPSLGSDDNPFDTMQGYSGQEYHREREKEWARQAPSGTVDPHRQAHEHTPGSDEGNTPSEAGTRAWVDPATGAVHGSGANNGGGGLAEDYDSDPHGGGEDGGTGARSRTEHVSGGTTMRADGTNADNAVETGHIDGAD